MTELIENIDELPKVMLVSVDTGEYDVEHSLEELTELCRTAGAEVEAVATQKRPAYDSSTCVGAGRLEEIAQICKDLAIDQVIFDCELSAAQIRNIEKVLDVNTIDRTMLILDIFAKHAKTREGKLQVELAQHRYRLPRLAGMGTALSRLGGGIGTRGPGETKLETDRRHIRQRIQRLEEELKEIVSRRDIARKRRQKDGVLCAAIVGYTNAGKSTLMDALTDAGVLAENKLFATLETTSRALTLPDGRSVLLTDTVGLISRLPHHLVEAFKSTLEEASSADVIIMLLDASSKQVKDEEEVVSELLSSLGCQGIPTVTVMNKCDLLDDGGQSLFRHGRVAISAKNKTGLSRLLEAVSKALPETARRQRLLIPFSDIGFASKIREEGRVFSEEYRENGLFLDALVDIKLITAASKYLIE